MASFTASFRVRLPERTGRTSAPSSSMRKTLSSWRMVSTSPMKTVHSRPNRAAAVAEATPCWPGSGLGDDPPLAHAPGEERLPDHVVQLVRAGVGQVLPLEQHPHARAAPTGAGTRSPGSGGRRSGAAGRRARRWNSGSAQASLKAASRSRQAGISDSGTNRPPNSPNRPSGPGSAIRLMSPRPASRRARRGPVPRPGSGSRASASVSAARALTMKSRTLSGSLRPGADSTPEETSTPRGPQVGHGLGHVARAQAARDDEPAGVGHPLGQPPVEDLARPGVVAVDQQVVGPELGEPA